MKLGFIFISCILCISKSYEQASVEDLVGENAPIPETQRNPTFPSRRYEVRQLLLPIRSTGGLLKQLFHFPVYVTYKRSGLNPHVRVIKRTPEEPGEFSFKESYEDDHQEKRQYDLDHQLRITRDNVVPHMRVTRAMDQIIPHMRVTRSSPDPEEYSPSVFNFDRSPHLRVVRSPEIGNNRHIRVTRSDQ